MAAPIIDWTVAEWIATRVSGDGIRPNTARLTGLGDNGQETIEIDLAAMAADAEQRVVAYTGLVPRGPLPTAEGVSRAEWVRSNISSSRAMIDPLVGRMAGTLSGRKGISLAASALVSAEIGVLVGYLGSRVLGQYELILLDEYDTGQEPRLLMVMPNLEQAITRFNADPTEFFTWVTLHEVTHAVQFGSVPWLRDHLAGLLRQMVASAEARLSPEGKRRWRLPEREELARIGRAARSGDLIGILASDADRAIFDQAQAVMAVIEGHAEHVMDAVAPELLPSLPDLRAKMSRRRKQQRLPGKLVNRALGMEMKMRQYEQGKAFCDAIVEGGGTDALRRLFSSVETLPSLAEVQAPADWLKRVG